MKHIVDSSSPRDGDFTAELAAPRALPRPMESGLARVPSVAAALAPESRLVLYSDPYSMEADKFRALRVYLRAMAKGGKLQVVMVTSALKGEGKSVSALNLAMSMTEQTGNNVILVEADLRNPSLTSRLGVESWPGLCQCMEDGSDPVDALRYISPLGIYLLPAGAIPGNPMQMLNSDRFAKVMQRLRCVADWIILDCPPVLPVPDVLALRTHVDGCLWVVKAHATARELVRDAMQQIGRELILGIVLNELKAVERAYAQYYRSETLPLLGDGA